MRLFTCSLLACLLLLKAASALLPACNIYTIKIWTRGLDLTPRSRHHGQIDRDKWAKWIGKHTRHAWFGRAAPTHAPVSMSSAG